MATTIIVLCHPDDGAKLEEEVRRWLNIHPDVDLVGDGVSEKREEQIIILEADGDSAPLWLTLKLEQHKNVTDYLLIEDEDGEELIDDGD